MYRKFALATLELYRETHPDIGIQLEWLLTPPRHSLLTELGRVARPRSDENGVLHWCANEVERLVAVALAIAGTRPSTKDGVALIRALKRSADDAHEPRTNRAARHAV